MLSSIQKMLQAFDENNIKYCHWKSNEHLNEALCGDTDLDMLFDPNQRSLLDKVLNECGLKRFRSVPLMQYNAIEDYIGMDEETARIWHLHLHYRMTLGEKHLKGYTITPWTDYILDNRIWDESGIYTSNPETEMVLLLIRIALKLRLRDTGRKLGKDDRIELNWLSERICEDKMKSTIKEMLGEDFIPVMLPLTKKELTKKGQFRKLYKKARKSLKIFTGFSKAGSRSMRSKREYFWLVAGVKRRLGLNSNQAGRRISPSGGSVVVFLGCDGAGKSTTLKYVKKELSKKIDVKSVYLGSGDGSSSLIRKPMKLIAKKVGGKGVGHAVEKEYSEKKKVSIKARLYSFAKIIWAVTLANEKKKKLREMTKARNNGLVVLCDRYPQIEVSGYSDGPLLTRYLSKGKGLFYQIARWEYSIYRSFYFNPPDLTIKLMVPTEVAIERKPEMTPEEIENKKAAIAKMNFSRNNEEIYTDCDINESLSKVMAAVWRVI